MKICDVVKNSIWNDPRVRKQIISYTENGVDLFCVGIKSKDYNEEEVKKIPCPVKLEEVNSKLRNANISVFKKIWREISVNKAIVKTIVEGNPDVIHANDLNALVPAYKAAKKIKCKLVYDTHEVFLENAGVVSNKVMKFIWGYYERKIVKKLDLMVCVSHAASDYFAEKYKIEKPMVVTNCALKSEEVDKISIEKNDGFEVLNHGKFYSGRGYETMVDACALVSDMPEIKLVVRGFGELEGAIREKAEKLKNKEQFKIYPPVLVKDMITSAAKSRVGVAITVPYCLNFKLSVSNKIFEYASAGLPVIMSDIPEHRYLNDKYGIGIVLRENTAECLAEAVRKFYNDRELYDRCVAGVEKMSMEVTWENEFKKLIDAEKKMV